MTFSLPLSMAQEKAVEIIKKEILMKEAMVKLSWLPLTAPPDVTSPLTMVFIEPDMLKRMASSNMKWLLKPQSLKMDAY